MIALSTAQVRRKMQSGEITYVRIGKSIRIPVVAAHEFLTKNTVQACK
jgi:hypothetical protein